MDYGKLLTDAWNTIWKNKFLILLGVLAALGNTSGSQSFSNGESAELQLPWVNGPGNLVPFYDLGLPAPRAGLLILLVGLALLVGLVFWITGTLARGGLIHGVDSVRQEGTGSFSGSFLAGWKNGWRLIGIAIVPALPMVVMAVLAWAAYNLYDTVRMSNISGDGPGQPNIAIAAPAAVLALLMLLVFLILSLLRNFAERACMLEGIGVIHAYRRGMQVLLANLGPAAMLFLLQIVLSVVLGLFLLLPGVMVALCCMLWPLLLLVQGLFASYYSTVWTLAWNAWSDKPASLEEPGTAG